MLRQKPFQRDKQASGQAVSFNYQTHANQRAGCVLAVSAKVMYLLCEALWKQIFLTDMNNNCADLHVYCQVLVQSSKGTLSINYC